MNLEEIKNVSLEQVRTLHSLGLLKWKFKDHYGLNKFTTFTATYEGIEIEVKYQTEKYLRSTIKSVSCCIHTVTITDIKSHDLPTVLAEDEVFNPKGAASKFYKEIKEQTEIDTCVSLNDILVSKIKRR